MIDPDQFARRQAELNAEFAKYVLDHTEVDDVLPDGAHVYFEVEGEAEFNEYGRALAERRQAEDGVPTVCVRAKGLEPPRGSRLIDPEIVTEAGTASAGTVRTTMAEPRYEIILYWSAEDDAYVAEIPELSGCAADGASYEDAIANVRVVIDEWIATATELGRQIPKPKGRPTFA